MNRAAVAALLVAAQLGAEEPKPLLKPIAIFNEHFYAGTFSSPRGISFDRGGNEILVADSRNHLIGIFTPDGVPLFAFRPAGDAEPTGVLTDRAGRILVIAGNNSRIDRYNYRGEFIDTLEVNGLVGKSIVGAIAFDGEGNFYVADNHQGQILVYDNELKLRRRVGRRGTEEGEFSSIADLAIDADGELYVVDHQASVVVQVFDKRGNFLRGWGRHDMGAEHFSLPEAIALDAKGHVFVIDALRHEIKLFTKEGQFIDRFGGRGWQPGAVTYPSDVDVDAHDNVYVVERGGSRVQVFRLCEKANC